MLAYPDAQVLDITGPLEVFSRTSRWLVDNKHAKAPVYEVQLAAPRRGRLRMSGGLELYAPHTYEDIKSADTLLVTGGMGFRAASKDELLLSHLRRLAKRAVRVGSICNGAVVLAAAGLLKNRRATTHWGFGQELANADATAQFERDAIFIKSGKFYTSAGVTAGMDMALAMVEEDWGRTIAIRVAQELVMYLKRPGGQSQFSRILTAQAKEGSPFETLPQKIRERLANDWRIPNLAAECRMSVRNFTRLFSQEFGAPPSSFVEQLRLEEAQRLLEESKLSLKEISRRTGLCPEQRLRRAFARHYGVSPQDYRSRFVGAPILKPREGQPQ